MQKQHFGFHAFALIAFMVLQPGVQARSLNFNFSTAISRIRFRETKNLRPFLTCHMPRSGDLATVSFLLTFRTMAAQMVLMTKPFTANGIRP